LKVNVKFHSAYKKYFEQDSYEVDITTYSDIVLYLKGVHPRFANYLRRIEIGEIEECVGLVDQKFNCITSDIQNVKRPKQGETIYITPIIAGGGGKGGTIVMAIALIAIAIAVPYAVGLSAQLAAAGGGMGIGATAGGFASVMATGFTVMGSFMSSLMIGIGMMGLNMLISAFTSKPKNPVSGSPDSAARTENNMFGALQNSTEAGASIPLHYGMTRVSGQFVSGYLHTTQHGRGNDPSVQSIFQANQTPNAILDEAA